MAAEQARHRHPGVRVVAHETGELEALRVGGNQVEDLT